MSERDVDALLRAAAERGRTTVDPDPDAVLSTMSPRLARARLVHRAQVGAGLCATLLVVGLAIMSMRPGGTNDNGLASPGPTVESPTDDAIEAELGDPRTQVATATAEATATQEATATEEPTEDDDPTPSATSTSSGTSSGTMTKSTEAGKITVAYTSSGMNTDLTFDLDSGWVHNYKKQTPELIELKLTKGDESIEVKIEFRDGEPDFDVEDAESHEGDTHSDDSDDSDH